MNEKKSYLTEMHKVRSQKFINHISIDICLLGAHSAIWTNSSSILVRALSSLILAAFIFRSFCVMHDAVHGCIVKKKRFNEFIGIFFGTFCFLPFYSWKKSHIEHHLWSGNIQKDPVMAFLLVYPNLNGRVKKLMNFGWKYWIPILGVIQNTVFWILLLKNWNIKTASKRENLSLLYLATFWGGLFYFTPQGYILTAVIPGVIFYLLAVEVVNLPHHLQLDVLEGNERLVFLKQASTARTCLYPKWVENFLVLNFNYHTAHHMYPSAPWYNLPSLHDYIEKEMKEEVIVDPMFSWNIENRKKTLDFVLYGEKSFRSAA